MKPLLPYIPEPLPGQANLKLYFAGDDGPSGQSHHEVVAKSVRLAHSGRSEFEFPAQKSQCRLNRTRSLEQRGSIPKGSRDAAHFWLVGLNTHNSLSYNHPDRFDNRSLTCPPGSPLRKNRLDLVLNDKTEASSPLTHNKTFIKDVMQSYDYCYNPKLWEIVRVIATSDVGQESNLTLIIYSTAP